MASHDIDPIIRKVVLTEVEGKRHFEIVLTRENLNFLFAGCPDYECLMGLTREGVKFYLFPTISGPISDHFTLMPNGDGYYADVGAPVESIPPEATDEDFARLNQRTDDNLEEALRNHGTVPMRSGNDEVGFVTLKVEEKKAPTGSPSHR